MPLPTDPNERGRQFNQISCPKLTIIVYTIVSDFIVGHTYCVDISFLTEKGQFEEVKVDFSTYVTKTTTSRDCGPVHDDHF